MSKRGVCGMGTCRKNRAAKCPPISQSEMKDKPRGTTDYTTCDGILIKKWKDNKRCNFGFQLWNNRNVKYKT